MRTKPALMSMFEMEVAAFNNNDWKTMSISILDGKFKISQSYLKRLKGNIVSIVLEESKGSTNGLTIN